MTERQQLFTDIAKQFSTPKSEREPWVWTGICDTVFDCPYISDVVTERAFVAFIGWLSSNDGPRATDYWWPKTDAGDEQRVLFCLIMAAMSDEDFYAVEDDND